MKNVKQIDIVLENCEVFKIPIEHIDILCKGVSRCISTWNGDGTVLDELSANKVMLIISETAFDIMSTCEEPLLERLTACPDITHVDIIYDDETNDYISVPWKGEDEFRNEAQKVTINDKNMLITLED